MRLRHLHVCATLVAFAAVSSGCAALRRIPSTGEIRAPGVDPRYEAIIDEASQMVRTLMARKRIPGLSIVLVSSRGLVWEAGFGYADDAKSIPVSPDTMFSIQSISKTFTAVGVLTAVRDGLLDLDEPITRYLPDLRLQSIFEEHPEDRITLRHLLTHTAGFTHEAPGGGNFDPAEPTFDEHVANIGRTWLMFRVGERYSYSNLGIDLAGYILQEVTGAPFADSMRKRVFQPLGLGRTTMDLAVIRAESNRATGHQKGFRTLPLAVPMTAAGGVYTTAHDLGSFLSFLLNEGSHGGSTLLPASAFTEMKTTPMNGGYGLGVAVGRREGDLFLNHSGGGYGFLSHLAWYPTLELGIAILTNSADHGSAHVELAGRIVDSLMEHGVAHTSFPLPSLPTFGLTLGEIKDNSAYFRAHRESTAWKREWQRYLGSYRLALYAEPVWYARLAMSLGFPRETSVRVRRSGEGMALDGLPLLEAEPGLFFTLSGEALDFRGDPPAYRNIELHKR